MERYLIAVDMDGTLLDSRNQVSKRNLQALEALLQRGHLVVPASGRALCLLPGELDGLSSHSYGILENGSFVWDYGKKACLFKRLLPQKIVRQILLDALAGGGYVELFADGQAYADSSFQKRLQQSGLGENFIRYFSENHVFTEDLAGQTQWTESAEKINVYFEDGKEGMEFRRRWEGKPGLTVTTSISGNAEFQAAGCSKGAALSWLTQKLGIRRECVVAIGDNENDLEMFETAGISVAMGNACEAVRRAADLVTADHDHDGVAAALEKLFHL